MHQLRKTLVASLSAVTLLVTVTANTAFAENDYWSGTENTTSDIGRTGKVGIGTTSPNAKLDVDGSATFNESGAAVDFRVEGDAKSYLFFVDGSGDTVGVGNFGTSQVPESLFELREDSDHTTLMISNDDNSGGYDPRIQFRTGSIPSVQFSIGVDNNDSERFKIGTSALNTDTAVTITTNREVGIGGITTPHAALHVQPQTDDQALKLQAYSTQTCDLMNVLASNEETEYLTIEGDGNFIFNESGGDVDFRIEGDSEENLFFVDASTDRIGIGTSSPTSDIVIYHSSAETSAENANALVVRANQAGNPNDGRMVGLTLSFDSDANAHSDGQKSVGIFAVSESVYSNLTGIAFYVRDTSLGSPYFHEKMRLSRLGNLGLGTTSPNAKLDVRGDAVFNEDSGDNDFRVEGETDANLIVADASADKVGIGTATPNEKLEVDGKIRANTAFNLNGTDGASGTATIVTDLQWNGSTLQMKTRDITTSGGIVTNLGTESGWSDVP